MALLVLLVAVATCLPQTAMAQATAIQRGGPTPHQVFDGSAVLVEHYNPAQRLRLALGLKHPYPAEEQQFLDRLQDKKSPMFHQFLSAKQWNDHFAPSKQDEQSVVDWAKSQGLTVTQRYPNRLIVDVEGTVDTIEKAFSVKINRYALPGR
jgi:subtilase family serine protease